MIFSTSRALTITYVQLRKALLIWKGKNDVIIWQFSRQNLSNHRNPWKGQRICIQQKGFNKGKIWSYWPRGQKAEAASVLEGEENLDTQRAKSPGIMMNEVPPFLTFWYL